MIRCEGAWFLGINDPESERADGMHASRSGTLLPMRFTLSSNLPTSANNDGNVDATQFIKRKPRGLVRCMRPPLPLTFRIVFDGLFHERRFE